MLSNAGIVTFGPVTGSRVWSGSGTMLPQTIIWYAMLMRSGIKAERTRTANRILRARQALVLPERRPPAWHEAMSRWYRAVPEAGAPILRRGADRCSAGWQPAVSPTGSRQAFKTGGVCGLPIRDTADCQSALLFSLDRAGGPDTLVPCERAEPIPTWPRNFKTQNPDRQRINP